MPHVVGSQLGAGLIDDLATVREKENAAILGDPAAD
jgi:hypothetical protein